MQKFSICLAFALAMVCLTSAASVAGPHGCYSSHCGKR
jgi:hypothetical protein